MRQISIVATQISKMEMLDLQRLVHGCKSDTITLSKSCYHGGTWAPHTTIVKFDVPSKSRQGNVLEPSEPSVREVFQFSL